MLQKNTPILVGVSQFTQFWQDGSLPEEPIRLIEKVSRQAFQDANISNPSAQIDGVYVVNIFGYGYEDAPALLAEKLGLAPHIKFYSAFGGNTPQYLVNKICLELEKGNLKTVLLAGGEASYGLAKALKSGLKLDWIPKKNPLKTDEENKLGSSDFENNYDLYLMTNAYPIFETAMRAKKDRTLEIHQQYIGQLYERLSKVASQNPFAWNQEVFSAEDIWTNSEDNRYVAFPYTKRMCANNQVDQAAALVLTTVENAKKLGIPTEKWVFPSGGANLNDIWDFLCRPDLAQSPAIEKASQLALTQAGISLEEITAFDLYSCFPVAVQVAMDSIGLTLHDSRPISLTGGLSFFGGPWNNYSMHAIASAVEKIRAQPTEKVLISALGWYMTKHAIGIYSQHPPQIAWQAQNNEATQALILSHTLPEPIVEANGKLKVLGYSVFCDRNGSPTKVVVAGELENGRRTLAWVEANPDELHRFQSEEWVNRVGTVNYNTTKKRNFVKF